MKILTYVVILVVVAAVIAGFFVLGTPSKERARRLDQQRVSHLENIQWQIINYWQTKKQLPAELDNLTNELNGFVLPADPETGLAYEYQVLNEENLTFELCADFKTQNTIEHDLLKPEISAPDWNWQHKAGRVCFERTIGPDLYPVLNKN